MNNISSFQNLLLKWYDKNGRHNLPWRNTTNIYHIYVSEIMLQQTQVNRVMEEYYPKFLDKFPTLSALSNASEEEVIAIWSGLGYYSRARNLHKTAQVVQSELPHCFNELIKLPGIGRYTASAICSFGHNQAISVIDTNIKRVLNRLFANEENIEKILIKYGDKILNHHKSRDHNLALMDLGSMVCLPRNPLCKDCPIKEFCKGKENPEFYTQKKKIQYESLELFLGIWIKNNKVALIKSQGPMYKNMLTLPSIEPIEDDFIGKFKHAYTKYKITVNLYKTSEDIEDIVWIDRENLQNIPISSLTRKALQFI